MEELNLSPEVLQAIALGVFGCIWMLWIAPARAYAAGVAVDDPPIGLRMPFFKRFRWVALVIVVVAVWLAGAPYDYQDPLNNIMGGDLVGVGVAFALLIAGLWVIPEIVAGQRVKKQQEPGAWRTPSLVAYRWGCLGLLILLMAVQPLGELPDPLMGAVLPAAMILWYLLYWGLPMMLIGGRVARQDPHAITARPRVRWSGWLGYIQYLISQSGRARKDDRAHKLCPSCMRPIDDIEDYDDFRFDTCPLCKETIPPAFSIEDYVKHYAARAMEQIEDRRSSKDARKKRGRRAGGRHADDLIQHFLMGMMTMSTRERGTDVHLLSHADGFAVKCRVDGEMFDMLKLPPDLGKPVISAVKVMFGGDITSQKPQDGSFKLTIDDKNIDVRVNTSLAADREVAFMRLLYRDIQGDIDSLGMGPRNLRMFSEMIRRSRGMILVTGPTGSGKSTTLYHALHEIADGKRNIITLEDPIEVRLPGINQLEVDESERVNFGFANGLRTIMRQDPDVIMVGEIRDKETAKMAIDAAMTGHLVFSTLHTIDAPTTIGRLLDLEVDPHRHADALIMIMAQRLVRLNCQVCSEEYVVTGDELEAMELPGAPPKVVMRRGKGCLHCRQTGYYEREGIFEFLTPDREIREMIAAREGTDRIRRAARRKGMRTLLEDGLTKAILGHTTLEEVLRVSG